jgi:hypothetical protein
MICFEKGAIDPGYADPDRFEARALEAAKLTDQPWLKVFDENGIQVLRKFDWNEKTQSGGWPVATSEEIENGIVCETKDEYLKLKAPPLGSFGTGDEARKLRAQMVNEQGVDAYLNRNKVA